MTDQPDTVHVYVLHEGDRPGHLRLTRCPTCSALVETDHADIHRLWHAEVSRG